jgi:arabinogalactan endo-1,4-beta-galactosidase
LTTEDVGHTVVHFLHTGGYETVSSPLGEGTSDLAREYKRSVLVYHASRNWALTDLEILAKQKMQHLDEEVTVLEILRAVRDVFSSLPAGETWKPAAIT